MFEAALEALSIVLDPSRLMFMLLGVSVGLIVGILPGLGGVVGFPRPVGGLIPRGVGPCDR